MTARHARMIRRAERRAHRRWYDLLRANDDDRDRAYELWDDAELTLERIALDAAGRRDLWPIARQTPATQAIAHEAIRTAYGGVTPAG